MTAATSPPAVEPFIQLTADAVAAFALPRSGEAWFPRADGQDFETFFALMDRLRERCIGADLEVRHYFNPERSIDHPELPVGHYALVRRRRVRS